MSRLRLLVPALASLLGPLVALPAPALAAPVAAGPPAETPAAERARLRSELDKVNAEIDALKRAGGVRDDYRLRARLADAEGLARRLMELDARLGVRSGPGAAARPLPAPTAAPTDGPADLDAKADILTDQSRRLRSQADAFGQRAKDMKGRQDLRRRAADLDRDPFAAMEGSKRRVASAASASPPSRTNGGTDTLSPTPSASGSGPLGGASSTPTVGIQGSTPATSLGVPAPVSTASSSGAHDIGPTAAQSLSVQLRDLLDTATLADLRRLEVGSTGGSVQALERAALALRARAAELDARARAMRAQARPQH